MLTVAFLPADCLHYAQHQGCREPPLPRTNSRYFGHPISYCRHNPRSFFAKPRGGAPPWLTRPIDGVIKADDERNLKRGGSNELCDHPRCASRSGIPSWTATSTTPRPMGYGFLGFFGCGKIANLLKIPLACCRQRAGTARWPGERRRPADILLPKVEDEIIRPNLRKAITTARRAALLFKHRSEVRRHWRASTRPDPGKCS